MLKHQMRLPQFLREYDMSRSTVDRLVHSQHFPAYKLGGNWYIDIDKYYEWRDLQNKKDNKYI